nr:MAG TPA: replication initiator protein [Caudoviricetes sp.]
MVYTVHDINENLRFIAVPLELLENPKLADLSLEAKFLYSYMRNRLSLSIKNNWIDGVVPYIHCTVDEIEQIIKKSRPTAIKIKKELIDFGLIETRKVFNGSDVIFVNKFTEVLESKTDLLPKVNELYHESKTDLLPKVNDLNSNYTNYNYTNNIYTDNNYNGSTTVGGNTLFSKAKKDKPASPATATPLGEFNQLILENFGKQPSPLQVDEMRYLVEEHKMEVLRLAVKEAVDNGKPYFAYLNGILNRWKHDGLTTAELVRNRVKPRKKSGKVTMLDNGYDPKLGI